ncbi:hypothetical protein HPB48_003955 [Haemaphysalis longicornis]|uniref:Cytochrome P450 n=1 Tax=Haemaphysalis longicornis TaxID=44386 RepID=A0A9J6FRH7_HAELO|nr:hypothetical protein HPB48_003955 [Haemaphysalis longicornis]
MRVTLNGQFVIAFIVMPGLIDAQKQFLEILGGIADAGTEVDIGRHLERLTFDVVSKAAFGIDTHVQKSTDNPLFQTAIQCFPNIMKGFFYNFGQNLYNWSWILRASVNMIDPFFENPLALMVNKAKEVIEFRRLNPQVDLPDMAQILLGHALKDRDTVEGRRHGETRNRGITLFSLAVGITRFSAENKHLIHPAVYQPFGLGVRMCVGQRLALVEMASVTAQVLRHFRITLSPSQKADLELKTCAFLVLPKDPVRIKLQRLQNTK